MEPEKRDQNTGTGNSANERLEFGTHCLFMYALGAKKQCTQKYAKPNTSETRFLNSLIIIIITCITSTIVIIRTIIMTITTSYDFITLYTHACDLDIKWLISPGEGICRGGLHFAQFFVSSAPSVPPSGRRAFPRVANIIALHL